MTDMNYLYYASVSPFKETLLVLAKMDLLNLYEIHSFVSGILPSIGLFQLETVLLELENSGLVVQINGCFAISEDWFKQLVLFLNEFSAERDFGGCNAIFEREAAKL